MSIPGHTIQQSGSFILNYLKLLEQPPGQTCAEQIAVIFRER